jgi:hypothetical protein
MNTLPSDTTFYGNSRTVSEPQPEPRTVATKCAGVSRTKRGGSQRVVNIIVTYHCYVKYPAATAVQCFLTWRAAQGSQSVLRPESA